MEESEFEMIWGLEIVTQVDPLRVVLDWSQEVHSRKEGPSQVKQACLGAVQEGAKHVSAVDVPRRRELERTNLGDLLERYLA